MRICVFAGSKSGHDHAFTAAARMLGYALLAQGSTLVYGGAGVGLMGVVADTILQGGGEVIGIVPTGLWSPEEDHRRLTQRERVSTLAERKARMIALADAFVCLPGGLGTLDELFEVLTLAQLGQHHKPIALLDVSDYFQPLSRLLRAMQIQGFLMDSPHEGAARLITDADPFYVVDLLETMTAAAPLRTQPLAPPTAPLTEETAPRLLAVRRTTTALGPGAALAEREGE